MTNRLDPYQLLHGPYRPPRLHRGDRATCLFRDGDVIITGWSDARIPWPRCRRPGTHGGGSGLLVNEELARAIRLESSLGIQHWWGVDDSVVWRWRRPQRARAWVAKLLSPAGMTCRGGAGGSGRPPAAGPTGAGPWAALRPGPVPPGGTGRPAPAAPTGGWRTAGARRWPGSPTYAPRAGRGGSGWSARRRAAGSCHRRAYHGVGPRCHRRRPPRALRRAAVPGPVRRGGDPAARWTAWRGRRRGGSW